MTPKEKANQLVLKYYNYIYLDIDFEKATQSALIAVDEIIKSLPPFEYGLEFVAKIEFWNNVKKEIEAL